MFENLLEFLVPSILILNFPGIFVSRGEENFSEVGKKAQGLILTVFYVPFSTVAKGSLVAPSELRV